MGGKITKINGFSIRILAFAFLLAWVNAASASPSQEWNDNGQEDESTSTYVALETSVSEDEEGAPFFEWISVLQQNGPDGVYTAVCASLKDPLGSVPHTIESLTVDGPGDFTYAFSHTDYLYSSRVYYRELSGAPADGIYTFTVVNSQGGEAITYFHLQAGETIIPQLDAGTLQASGDPTAPTLSWGAPPYQGNLFYRARIYNASSGSITWTSSFSPDTCVKVQQGVLSPEGNYIWRVEAFDDYSFIVSNKRVVTEKVSLNIDNSSPFFERAAVYSVPRTDGISTAVTAWPKHPDGSVPGSIDHISVTGPGGGQVAVLDYQDFLEPWQMFFMTLDGIPAPGIYEFEVTDTEGHKTVTYDYVTGSTVPVVSVDTLQASGGGSSPLVLSWGAPGDISGPIYYRVIILDEEGHRIWASPPTVETAVTVPGNAGIEQGEYYEWEVRARDFSVWTHHNTESRSAGKQLAIDNSSPYFRWAAAFAQDDQAGSCTALDVSVYDPDGELPADIERLEVEGPGGFSMDILNDPSTAYFTQFSEFWTNAPAGLDPGVYTFTVEDMEGNIATTSAWLGEAPIPPAVDPATIQVTGNPTAPTLSWGAAPEYEARPYYRLRVYDSDGNNVYRSGRKPQTFQVLPYGIIQPGETYFFRLETQDHPDWVTYNARSNSVAVAWVAPEHVDIPVISGRVTDTEGRPIEGLLLQAYEERCGGNLLGWTFTEDDGTYLMQIEAEEVFIKTDARYDYLPYQDKWFDWAGGTENCSLAARLILPGNRKFTDIDFFLKSLPERVMFFEVVVANGVLGGGFSVEPGYKDQILKASMVLPNPARNDPYVFDLVSDKFFWDSDCRYLEAWWHNLGSVEGADYGRYTLIVEFKDGSKEAVTWDLEPATVFAVDQSSISVDVHENGDAVVKWNRPGGTNQYYQVRVREYDSGKEVFKSDMLFNADQLFIPSSELACLELDKTYRWLVRIYDDAWPLYNRSETRETTAEYSPADLLDRVTYWEVIVAEGDVMIDFLLRPGSKNHITEAVIWDPTGSSYTFELTEDRFDLSSETRLTNKGWFKRFESTAESYGLYRLEVTFSDGYTQTLERILEQVEIIPVQEESMTAVVNPDGSVKFSWAIPAGAGPQRYQVRVRSEDGSKEYYASLDAVNATEVTAWPYDLRGLEPGSTYGWHVRAYDENHHAREQSTTGFFLYDPFTEDELFDLGDAIRVLQILAGSQLDKPFPSGDLDGDGRLGTSDVITMLQEITGLR